VGGSEQTFSETEVNKMLGEQAEKHDAEIRDQAVNHQLENIDTNVNSVKEKVCKHVDDAKQEKEKILKAIENVGAERRHCEDRVNTKIDDMHEYNHNTFVKKTDLRIWALLIVGAVSVTTTVIGYYGPQKEFDVGTVNQIAKTIIKELGK